MENKMSERNVVLGLTIISMLLVVIMIVTPAMAFPQSDIAHGISVYKACKIAASGSLSGTLKSIASMWGVTIARLIYPALVGGPLSTAAIVAFL